MRQKVTQRLLQMVRTAAKKAKATRSGTTVQSSTRRLQSLGKKKREEKKQKKEMSAMLAVEIRRDSENLNIRNRIFEVRTKAPKTVAVKASFSCSAWGASCPAGWFGNMKFGREKNIPTLSDKCWFPVRVQTPVRTHECPCTQRNASLSQIWSQNHLPKYIVDLTSTSHTVFSFWATRISCTWCPATQTDLSKDWNDAAAAPYC